MLSFLTDGHWQSREQLPNAPIDFYREEFLKHRLCLELQREYYSERAIVGVEVALERVMMCLDDLCRQGNAERVIGRLLRTFDVLTGLSAWSDPKKVN
jgi:hypothetical protein